MPGECGGFGMMLTSLPSQVRYSTRMGVCLRRRPQRLARTGPGKPDLLR